MYAFLFQREFQIAADNLLNCIVMHKTVYQLHSADLLTQIDVYLRVSTQFRIETHTQSRRVIKDINLKRNLKKIKSLR